MGLGGGVREAVRRGGEWACREGGEVVSTGGGERVALWLC